ncbi:MAG: hypothetical protein K0S47_997 [Herbinix sp.]|nr:hypothetical protein [Herbinix sp.]
MELCELFPGRKCREHIIKQIDTMIAEEFAKGNQVYFDDYSQLVEKSYKGNQFYLTPEGVVIYFQHSTSLFT